MHSARAASRLLPPRAITSSLSLAVCMLGVIDKGRTPAGHRLGAILAESMDRFRPLEAALMRPRPFLEGRSWRSGRSGLRTVTAFSDQLVETAPADGMAHHSITSVH